MEINEFVLHEKARCDCYRLLAACFYLPQKELFLQENLFKNLAASLNYVFPEAAIFSNEMENAILNCSNEELSVEYAKLFVGPYELKAPPYGSIYLDKERKVMGDSTMEVMQIYNDAGLSIDSEFHELPDHVAVELEFMYYLIYRETEAIERCEIEKSSDYVKTQDLFLDKFMCRWIPPFCKKIKEGADNKFYNALADCVSALVSSDKEYISIFLRKRLLEFLSKEKTEQV